MMELNDFITKTLVEIVRGIEQAQEELQSSNTRVNPRLQKLFANAQTGGSSVGLGWADNGHVVAVVLFDVGLAVEEGKNTKGGIGVAAGIFSLAAQGASGKAQTASTRVQFSVPIMLPQNTDAAK